MCQSAVEKGIPEIGITDHFDLHPYDECRNHYQAEAWWAELRRSREKFDGRLTIRAGVELGEPHLFAGEAAALLAAYPYDYCLGSLHHLGELSVFDRAYFDQPMDAGYGRYFQELERMTHAGGFDVLSHFDVVLRYGVRFYGGYDPARYEAMIRQVLQNCIEHGIALDINTAVVRRYAKQLCPGVQVLTWFREMGGELVTLGSDSHQPQNVGADLDLAIAAAQQAGFEFATQFEARRPKRMPFDGRGRDERG